MGENRAKEWFLITNLSLTAVHIGSDLRKEIEGQTAEIAVWQLIPTAYHKRVGGLGSSAC